MTELERVQGGPNPGDRADGMLLLELDVQTAGSAAAVLARAREVMTALLANFDMHPDLERWRQILPGWFVETCRPEESHAEAEAWLRSWRSMSRDEQVRAEEERGWTLANWLYWFEPEQRFWFWWDARVVDPDTVRVAVEAHEMPPPLGSFEWLFKAAGASNVRWRGHPAH